MNTKAILLVVLVAVVALVQGETYRTDFDDVDPVKVIADKARVDELIQCLLADNDSKCSPIAKFLREIFPESIATDCSKCTEAQKKGLTLLFGHITNNRVEDTKKIMAKWDPKGESANKYRELWATRGIKV